MSELEIVSEGYKKLSGNKDFQISPLQQSGSDRKYFRITGGQKSVIGAFNSNHEENEAFIGFTKHFLSQGLPVPEIISYSPEKFIYFLQDLGDINLFAWLQKKHSICFLNGKVPQRVESLFFIPGALSPKVVHDVQEPLKFEESLVHCSVIF